MKKLILFTVFITIAMPSFSQTSINQKLSQAYRLISYPNGEEDLIKAFNLYSECANSNSTKAMNALGNLYQEGIGVDANINTAIDWYEKSCELGYSKACFNLGKLYKEGEKVELDIDKAFNLFNTSALMGYYTGYYSVGYMYYKGIGTEQNYQQAVKWFERGAELDRADSMYMLAYCLRNGYGTEKNETLAKELFIKSANKGYWQAKQELYVSESEIHTNNNKRVSKQLQKIITYKKSIDSIVDISGSWVGKIFVLDYGKEKVLKTKSISIDIKTNGQAIEGIWKEKGFDKVKIIGTINNNTLYYAKDSTSRLARYGQKRRWNLEQGSLYFASDNQGVMLVGNLKEFSNDVMEYGKPMLIKLRKQIVTNIVEQEAQKQDVAKIEQETSKLTTKGIDSKNQVVVNDSLYSKQFTPPLLTDSIATNEQDLTIADNNKNNNSISVFHDNEILLSIYPNPFETDFAIEYNVNKKEDTNIYIFDMQGNIVKKITKPFTKTGKHTLQISISNSPGIYLLTITNGSEKQSRLIVKE